jgi:hypothetical protein
MSDVELPSNRKFGLFFSAFSFILSIYFYFYSNFLLSYILITVGFLFFTVALIKSDLLLPLNNLWMWFGMLIGRIVSPIVLGVVYFGLFTPMSFIMRLIRRDELRLRANNDGTKWISRENSSIKSASFKNQF